MRLQLGGLPGLALPTELRVGELERTARAVPGLGSGMRLTLTPTLTLTLTLRLGLGFR